MFQPAGRAVCAGTCVMVTMEKIGVLQMLQGAVGLQKHSLYERQLYMHQQWYKDTKKTCKLEKHLFSLPETAKIELYFDICR